MCIPAILKKVKKGAVSAATKAETEATYEDRHEDLVPTLSIGMLAVICAITGLGIGLSALNGVALGVLVAISPELMIMNRDNKPSTFLNTRAYAVHRGPWSIAHAAGLPGLCAGLLLVSAM